MSHVTRTCACTTYSRLAIPLKCNNHISYIMTKQYGNMGKKDNMKIMNYYQNISYT